MTAFSRVALIGFGEVGQTLGADLVKAGVEVSAHDILFGSSDSAPSRVTQTIAVRKGRSASDATANAELIVCAVTSASDVDAARSGTAGIPRGAFYVDLNSVSPATKTICARIVDDAGGRYVEA